MKGLRGDLDLTLVDAGGSEETVRGSVELEGLVSAADNRSATPSKLLLLDVRLLRDNDLLAGRPGALVAEFTSLNRLCHGFNMRLRDFRAATIVHMVFGTLLDERTLFCGAVIAPLAVAGAPSSRRTRDHSLLGRVRKGAYPSAGAFGRLHPLVHLVSSLVVAMVRKCFLVSFWFIFRSFVDGRRDVGRPVPDGLVGRGLTGRNQRDGRLLQPGPSCGLVADHVGDLHVVARRRHARILGGRVGTSGSQRTLVLVLIWLLGGSLVLSNYG